MDDFQIDDAVLAVAKPSWKKVALMIVEAADKLGKKFPGADEDHHWVASVVRHK
jgi:hypothetical protein